MRVVIIHNFKGRTFEMTDISQRILHGLAKFSKGHKKIANAVLNDYDKIAYMTASKLGKFVNTSESTVVRFACVLGYEGYAEFQLAVQELTRTKLTPNQRIAVTKERLGENDVLRTVLESDINKLKFTLENLDRNAFYNSVNAILNAKSIYITGARSAEPIARLMNHNFSMIFDNVKFIQPMSSAEVFEQMYSIGEGDVLVAFSFPRYSTKIINAVKYAKSKGVEVVVITDSQISPLAEHADYLLTAQTDMASFMDSLVAPISIINAMVVQITKMREKEITDRFENLEKMWDEYHVYAKR